MRGPGDGEPDLHPNRTNTAHVLTGLGEDCMQDLNLPLTQGCAYNKATHPACCGGNTCHYLSSHPWNRCTGFRDDDRLWVHELSLPPPANSHRGVLTTKRAKQSSCFCHSLVRHASVFDRFFCLLTCVEPSMAGPFHWLCGASSKIKGLVCFAEAVEIYKYSTMLVRSLLGFLVGMHPLILVPFSYDS